MEKKIVLVKELEELLQKALIDNKNIQDKKDLICMKRIIQIIQTYGNGYSQVITAKKNKDLKDWLFLKTSKLQDSDGFRYQISTRVFWVLSGMTDFPKCLHPDCTKDHFGENMNISLRPLHGRIGYPLYCSKECRDSSPIVKKHREETNTNFYGVKNTYQSEEKKQIIKKTLMKRYHVDHPSKCPEIIQKGIDTRKKHAEDDQLYLKKIDEKTKATKLKNHGDPNYNNLEQIKKTNLEKRGVEFPTQDPKVIEIRERNNLKRYGFREVLQLPWIHQLAIEACLRKFGKKSSGGDPNCIQKKRQTCLERYHVDSYFKADDFPEKAKATSLRRYNTEFPSQSPVIKEKIIQGRIRNHGTAATPSHRYIFNGIDFDSSWELYFWIYCVDHGYPIKRSTIMYDYYIGKEKHRYNVDFEVYGYPIEIKGPQFFDKNGNLIVPYKKNKKQSEEKYQKQIKVLQAKLQCMIEHKVLILSKDEVKACIKYVNKKYGKRYLNQFLKKYIENNRDDTI